MAKKKVAEVVVVTDEGDEDAHDKDGLDEINAPSTLIPVSKKEKERLLASWRLTLLIAGRGMRHGENYQLSPWEEIEE